MGGRGNWKILKTKLRERKPENIFPAQPRSLFTFHGYINSIVKPGANVSYFCNR